MYELCFVCDLCGKHLRKVGLKAHRMAPRGCRIAIAGLHERALLLKHCPPGPSVRENPSKISKCTFAEVSVAVLDMTLSGVRACGCMCVHVHVHVHVMYVYVYVHVHVCDIWAYPVAHVGSRAYACACACA